MRRNLLFALIAIAADAAPDACGECSAHEGTYDEYPEVVESLSALEHGGSDAACGVYAGAGVVDAYQVNEDEAESNG